MSEVDHSPALKKDKHEVLISQSTISGPLPPPIILQQYGQINPSFPERIVAMAEKEQELAHSLQTQALDIEKSVASEQIILEKRGQNIAVTITVFAMAAAVYLGMNGHDWLAGLFFSSVLLGIIRAIMATKQNN